MEKELFKFEKDLQEISKIQQKYEYGETGLAEIHMNEEMEISMNGEIYKGTELFYKNFYHLLNIPYPFAQSIPSDLIVHNTERLNDEFNRPVRFVHRDGTLINIQHSIQRNGDRLHFQTVDTSNLLEYFNTDNFDIKNVYVGDYGSVIDVIHKDLGDFSVNELGKIEVGYRLKNPFTFTNNRLGMSLYLFELVCSNGMVLGKEYANVTLSLNKKLGDELSYVERFKNNIDMSISKGYSLKGISEIYSEMSKTNIKYRWLKPIFGKIRNYDRELFHNVFSVNWDEEKEYYKEKFEKYEDEDSEFKYFDTIFGITKEAQKESGYLDKLYLEEYNSNIINLFNKQKIKSTTYETREDGFEED